MIRTLCLVLFVIGGAAVPAFAASFPGPDNFGHRGYEIPFGLRDVSLTGDDIGLDEADDEVALVSLGFDFNFYGIDYSEVEVSSNGFLSFTPTGNDGCCDGETIPTADSEDGSGVNNFVAGYWQDLDPGEGGTVRTQTLGPVGSREFVLGYYEVRDNDDPANSVNTLEIILHEGTNFIELQLGQIQFDDVDSKVIGIENVDGTDGLEVFFFDDATDPFTNGDLLFFEQAFLIVPEPSTVGLAWLAMAALSRPGRRAAKTG